MIRPHSSVHAIVAPVLVVTLAVALVREPFMTGGLEKSLGILARCVEQQQQQGREPGPSRCRASVLGRSLRSRRAEVVLRLS